MACKIESTHFELTMKLLIENGFDRIADTIGVLMNSSPHIQRSRHLNAEPYERNIGRRGYSNGYKKKPMQTRFEEGGLAISQARYHWHSERECSGACLAKFRRH